MQDRLHILHPASVVVATTLVVAAALAGCSSLGPESTWSGNAGDLSGTVRSDSGESLTGIEVCLCTGDGQVVTQVTTDACGDYRITDVELTQAHAYAEAFWVYVNRTSSSATALQDTYSTYASQVTVETGTTVSVDVVLVEEGPGQPSEYVDH
jgi:hypothetical protein